MLDVTRQICVIPLREVDAKETCLLAKDWCNQTEHKMFATLACHICIQLRKVRKNDDKQTRYLDPESV